MGISAGVSSRPPPSQADITKVISNNRGNIKTCYQRALLRDNTLTHGKIAVKLSIGISGRVKHVGLEGPPQFKTLEPCIKEVVQRWVFPQASEEYGTEFRSSSRVTSSRGRRRRMRVDGAPCGTLTRTF